jgi:hypothetical protein
MGKLDILPSLTEDERAGIERLRKIPITFAFNERGNGIYGAFVIYLLRQHDVFENASVIRVNNDVEDATEDLLTMAGYARSEFVHVIDPTVAPQQETSLRLMAHDLDIVGAPVYQYDGGQNMFMIHAFETGECLRIFRPKPPEVGLERVFSCSLANCMIKRRVLETFMQVKERFCTWSDLIDKKYQHARPDIIFFAKAEALGFDVSLDWACAMSDSHNLVRMNPPSMEAYVSHGVLSYVIGTERTHALLKDEAGREELAAILRESKDAFRPRPAPVEGNGDVPNPAGACAPACQT